MKLDLFYEIDVPRPWPGEFPENQRHAEQESYDEALEHLLKLMAEGWAAKEKGL